MESSDGMESSDRTETLAMNADRDLIVDYHQNEGSRNLRSTVGVNFQKWIMLVLAGSFAIMLNRKPLPTLPQFVLKPMMNLT